MSYASCKNITKPKKAASSCIDDIIKADDSLGTIRNHACETISISETITQYTSSLKNLDYKDCPIDFTEAFNAHIKAWRRMTHITDKHSELRGEMHVLFDSLEVSNDSVAFKMRLKTIWDTWETIEATIKK